MDKIKLKTWLSKIHKIDKTLFETLTGMKQPYYPDGEKTLYPLAVCPQCENPVQIMGFYKRTKNAPFGKHYPHSVKGLAIYEQMQYKICPYHEKRKTIPSEEKLSEITPNAEQIKAILRDYFDQIVYFAGRQTGIFINDKQAERMLKTFVNGERWLYPWITLNNLPWIFVYLSWSQNIYGKLIAKGSWLHQNIEMYKSAKFEDYSDKYSKLVNKENECFQPCFCFMHHKREIVADKLNETILFKVSDNDIEICSTTLEISETAFVNLLAANDGKRSRKEQLLNISKRVFDNLQKQNTTK